MADLNTLYGALYDLIASGSRGATLRALYGGVTITLAELLSADSLPAGPFLAWRQGPTPISERTLQLPVAYWTIFDVSGYADRRLNAIAAALVTAYAGDDLNDAPPISGVAIDGIEVDAGEPYTDTALGRRALPITITMATT